jgi:NAD(P)-dependent dehydrogenase (short-subunit alcohol dehydrogenase family)
VSRVRSAVVTGAASGIGRATALRLAADGFRIVALDRNADGLSHTAARIGDAGGAATTHTVDLCDGEAVDEVVEGAIAEQAPAALVNIAGVGVAATLVDTPPEEWDLVIGVNLTGVYRMCRAVLPAMIAAGSGVVVNVASVAGRVGLPNRAAYCASKAGVVGLTRAIAVDHAAQGIRAVAISPGTVATEWIDTILAGSAEPAAARAAMQARQLDGRMGTPEEVAAGIAFVCSPDGRFLNGSDLVMDGGFTAR